MRPRLLFTIVCVFVIQLAWNRPVSALVSVHSSGLWPSDWPAELERFRKQARTFDVATGSQEHVYEITFKDREEFERAWPSIMSVKSPGAPIRLQRRMPLISKNPRSSLFGNEQPCVRIFGPTGPGGVVRGRDFVGELQTGPPWSGLELSPSGFLPAYVQPGVRNGESVWVAAELGKGRSGFYHRARIELELVVDGNVIDLNRIELPADTPIVDHRWKSDVKK